MKVTFGKIISVQGALRGMLGSGAQVSPKAALLLARTVKVLDAEMAAWEEGRRALVAKYVSGDEGKIAEDKLDEANAEMLELSKTEVDIDVQPIPIDALGDCQLSMDSLIGMEWLFE